MKNVASKIVMTIISLILLATALVPIFQIKYKSGDKKGEICSAVTATHFIKYGLFDGEKLEEELSKNYEKESEEIYEYSIKHHLSAKETEKKFLNSWYYNAIQLYGLKTSTMYNKISTNTMIYAYLSVAVYGMLALTCLFSFISIFLKKGNIIRGISIIFTFLAMLGSIGMTVFAFLYKETIAGTTIFGLPTLFGYIVPLVLIIGFIVNKAFNKRLKKVD